MLLILLAVSKAITISALGLQLAQPIVPPEPISGANLALSNRPQGTVNASLLSNSSNTISQHWDGTIALPLNGFNTSISFPLLSDLSQLWNDTPALKPNTSTVSENPIRPPDLPPWPQGWAWTCKPLQGIDINPSSCLEAWTLLPPIERTVSFGPRSAGNTYDVGLPQRYLSCTLRPLLLACH